MNTITFYYVETRCIASVVFYKFDTSHEE